MFKDIFSFYGRIRRTEYALTYVFYVLVLLATSIISEASKQDWVGIFVLLPIYLLISQGAKRCHDRGNSGWYMLIPFYPIIMLFGAGDYGPNEYGDNPKGEGNIVDDPFGYYGRTEAGAYVPQNQVETNTIINPE